MKGSGQGGRGMEGIIKARGRVEGEDKEKD